MPYDNETAMPGRSMEIDAEIHAATQECKTNKGFKANAEDAAAGAASDEPQGNTRAM